MIRLSLILLLLVALGPALWAQSPAPVTDTPAFVRDSLDDYVRTAMRESQVPGVAVLVFHQGRVVVARGYGVRRMGGTEPVTEHTRFGIGSNTKAFTGTAVALLQAEGKLKLDDRVTQYLPTFKLRDPAVTQLVTLRDLLSHRLGLETFQGDFTYWNSNLTAADVIERMGRIEAVHDFRTRWGYCNAGFTAAGEVVRAVSGQPWSAFVQARILTPLGMRRTLPTLVGLNVDTLSDMAVGHMTFEGQLQTVPYSRIGALAPAGDIYSSVHDMRYWVEAQLNEGKLGEREVLPRAAVLEPCRPAIVMGANRNPRALTIYRLYGLGWQLEDYRGTEVVSHTGGVDGFASSVTLVPKLGLGIVVLTNSLTAGVYESVKRQILDAYFGTGAIRYHAMVHGRDQKAEEEKAAARRAVADTIAQGLPLPSGLSLARLAGSYRNAVYGTITLRATATGLKAEFSNQAYLSAELRHIKDGRFECLYSDPAMGRVQWDFTVGADGRPAFVHRVDDFVEFTTYTFVQEPGR